MPTHESVNVHAEFAAMAASLNDIESALRTAKVKSIAAQKKYIQEGALFGVVPNYYKLGRIVASIVDRHHNRERLENIPVALPREPIAMINKTTAAALSVDISEEFAKDAIIVE